MGNSTGNSRTILYALLSAVAFMLVVGLALTSVAVKSMRKGLLAPTASMASGVATASTPDDSSEGLDPTKAPTAWGYEVAKTMSRAFPENDGALITAGELLSLGPMVAAGERIPWDKMKDTGIVKVEMNGTDLMTAVASAVKYYPRKNSSFLQIFGLRALCRRTGKTTQLRTLVVGDDAVLPDKIYRLAVTEFLAKGAGPFLGLKSVKAVSEPVSLLRELRKRLFPVGVVLEPEQTYFFSRQAK